MRLSWLIGGVFLLAALTLLGCGKPAEVDLSVPWTDGEISAYQLSQRGEAVGTIRLSLEEKDGAWEYRSVTEVSGFIEEVRVLAGKESLVPFRVDFLAKTQDTEISYQAVYQEGKAVINARKAGGAQSAQVKLPSPPYFENEQFLMLVRALPLQAGWEGRLNIIVTRTASKTELALEVVDRETVETPVGALQAWKVELEGANQFAWVEVEPPHRLVKYVNGNAETVSLLAEYRSGG
ncbi:MAG: DUF3108 domain-containing protein [Bacillota bacterium]